MSVHVHLLVDSGIHIIEVLNLEELARDQVNPNSCLWQLR